MIRVVSFGYRALPSGQMPKLAPPVKERNLRGPQLDGDWQARFLKAYARHGAKWKAAKIAGVAKRTVDAYEASDPDFAEQSHDAKQLYLDNCQAELRRIGRDKHNPLPLFGILKAGRPDEWNDVIVSRSVSLNVNVDASPAEALPLLQRMIGASTDATRQALGAPEPHRGDEAVRALPERTEDVSTGLNETQA